MSEIEKLYENAGIKKQYCGWLDMGDLDCQMRYVTCNSINEWKESVLSSRYGESEEEPELKYPDFTAEKQLDLIKWLSMTKAILIKQNRIFVGFETGNPKDLKCVEDLDLNFEETLAGLVNNLWQNLTETEKAEIKRILE